ncbi:peptidylprolyl isomerase [Paenibacillus solisilvae]|uniref:Peptidylprolyl isomerase n=1 Tax=Paenibacillus solisilvae TaxID=2486751 RepID=A0ABW0VVU2_9BACL
MLRTSYSKKSILLVLAVMLIALLAAGCGKSKEEAGGAPGAGEGKVIATYTDGKVTETEFNKYTTFYGVFMNQQADMYLSIPQLKEQVLRQYIAYKVLYAKIDNAAKDKVKAEAGKFYDNFKTNGIDKDAELKKKLDTGGLDEEGIKYFYTVLTVIQQDQEGKVTDADVKKEYDSTKDDFNVISVRHILIGTVDPQTGAEKRKDEEALKIAKEVKQKLDAGGDWKALAKQYSEDDGSKENGGLYENQQAKAWVAEFKDAANKQEIGKVGDPVKSSYGYHVMEVEKRTPTPFDKLKAEDLTGLKQAVAAAKMNDFVTKDLEKLNVKITLPEAATDAGKTNDTTTKDDAAKTDEKTGTK